MKILVTGGNGFIGTCFRSLLYKEPSIKIINVDCLTYAANNIHFDGPNYVFYKTDIRDYAAMEEIFKKEKPDIVVNFAAETHVDRSWIYPELFYDVNVNGTRVLLDLSLKYGVKRYHQVSTDEVYGSLGPDSRPFKETDPLNPTNPYSKSKAAADELVLEYYHKYGLPITISRCTNNYGPYQYPEKLIPLVITKASNNEPIPVYGDGLNVRDWIYVEDHCRGILAILEKGRVGEIYNLGSHNEKTNLEIIKMILSRVGKPESLVRYVNDRPCHDKRYAIDPYKAGLELNWEPVTSFEAGIKMTSDWYLFEKGKKWLEEHVESGWEWLNDGYDNGR